MVVFTCNYCGSSVKKNQVEKHYTIRCFKVPFVSCMDCSKDFKGDEFQAHTECITEAEKYSGGNFTPKASTANNQKKREEWTNTIKNILSSQELGKKERDLVEVISTQSNVPQKKQKFMNFALNAVGRQFGQDIIENVWSLLEEQLQLKQKEKSENTNLSNADLGQEQIEEQDSTKLRKMEEWMNAINDISTDEKHGKKEKELLKCIINLEKVPQLKKKKFCRFVNQNFPNQFENETIENVWSLLEEQLQVKQMEKSENTNQNNANLGQEQIEEQDSTKLRKMEEWMNAIKVISADEGHGKKERELLKGIINLEKVPHQKKKMFCRFVNQNLPNQFENEIIENVWNLLQKSQVPKPKREMTNEQKRQAEWADAIKSIPTGRKLSGKKLELVEAITKHSVPQKKGRFLNFVKRVFPDQFEEKVIEKVWILLEEKLQVLKPKQNVQQNNMEDSSNTENMKKKGKANYDNEQKNNEKIAALKKEKRKRKIEKSEDGTTITENGNMENGAKIPRKKKKVTHGKKNSIQES